MRSESEHTLSHPHTLPGMTLSIYRKRVAPSLRCFPRWAECELPQDEPGTKAAVRVWQALNRLRLRFSYFQLQDQGLEFPHLLSHTFLPLLLSYQDTTPLTCHTLSPTIITKHRKLFPLLNKF